MISGKFREGALGNFLAQSLAHERLWYAMLLLRKLRPGHKRMQIPVQCIWPNLILRHARGSRANVRRQEGLSIQSLCLHDGRRPIKIRHS